MVLQNLIENAAKYTPAGGRVRIRAAAADDWAVVGVANTGNPIPAGAREKLFERFHRGPTVGENVRGHGLGLNIARELVRAHGGELLLKDGADPWTDFEFRLPAATSAPAVPA
jgi:signal transduction histidine kinase